MAILAISYDLHKSGQEYSDLYKAIKECGQCIHPLDSFWLVKTLLTNDQVFNKICPFIDTNDRLIVGEINHCSYRFNANDVQWIKNNL